MDASLLDTDTISEILKRRNAAVMANATAYLHEHSRFTFSAFSRFEIRRGYVDTNATRQLTKFERFCAHSLILPISDAILDRAALLWSHARRGGHPKGDADLIIAATAQEHGLTLITGNTPHFAWIPGLKIEDWRE